MKRRKRLVYGALLAPLVIVLIVPTFLAFTWGYTTVRLEVAKWAGIYPTAEDGMLALVAKSWYGIERVEIESAGPNSFDGSDPHVWFVTAKVWAARRADWQPVGGRGYDSAGSYFLHVREGWVHMPEGAFPEFVGFGMKLFRIDLPEQGQESATPRNPQAQHKKRGEDQFPASCSA